MSMGCTAVLRSGSCNRGQKYFLLILFHTIKLVKTLITNKMVASIIDIIYNAKETAKRKKTVAI